MDRGGFMMRWRMGRRSLGALALLFGLIVGYAPQPAEAQTASCTPQSSNLPKPTYPVIFIHGINSSADGAWGDLRCVLVANGWTDGGSPQLDGSSVIGVNVGNNDFYTLNFSNSHDLTFSEQGFELARIISAVKQANSASKVILVGHSMGGLAARAYLQEQAVKWGSFIPYGGDVDTLITIGTPHQGSMETKRCLGNIVTCNANPIVDFLFHPESVAFNALVPDSYGLSELNDFTTYTDPILSPLPNILPPDVRYVSIVVTWKYQDGRERMTLTDIVKVSPYLLYGDGGDGIVTETSQDLSKVPGFTSLPAAANHRVVPVTFRDPLWNTTSLTVTGTPPACGHQIDRLGTLSINEVHTCETHDASVAYQIVQSIPKTSAGAGLPMVGNVPLSIHYDGIAQ